MTTSCNGEDYADQLKRGPWTLEEDNLLIHYINCHGEGRWNSLAKSAGLKRTGKSCRLRWLNYLKPDTKRGNLTPQEQLVILDLHSKLGNRWSKIARHLPGRTDNEIKNYWRTRVQKQARHLKIDSGSKRFAEALQRFWMPRLLEKIEQTSSSSSLSTSSSSSTVTASTVTIETDVNILTDHPQITEQTVFTSLSPPQPISNQEYMINSSSINSICELPDQVTQMYGDTAFYNSSLQNIGCYNNSMDMINELDDMINFQLADNDWLIRSRDMAADTYWNMDELW